MLDGAPQTIEDVVASSIAGVAQAVETIHRFFDVRVEGVLGAADKFKAVSGQLDLAEAGLIVVAKLRNDAALITISAETLVPPWCVAPDTTGQSKMSALAEALTKNLYPEAWSFDSFEAHWAPNIAEALMRGGVLPDATVIPIVIQQGGSSIGVMGMVWPAARPDAIPYVRPGAASQPAGSKFTRTSQQRVINAEDLPNYTRSLLRIQVPVTVTLAHKRQALSRILELSPGSIIQFDKSCEEMLDLTIGGQPVATGEAVKLGDKFGLRVTSIASPDERFHPAVAREFKPRNP